MTSLEQIRAKLKALKEIQERRIRENTTCAEVKDIMCLNYEESMYLLNLIDSMRH